MIYWKKRHNIFFRQNGLIIIYNIYVLSQKSRNFKRFLKIFGMFLPSSFYRKLVNLSKNEYNAKYSKIKQNQRKSSISINEYYKCDSRSIIYLYVDHTCNFPHNTGIQQLVRQCLVAFVKKGYGVIPVKWNFQYARFQEIDSKELSILTQYCDGLSAKNKSILLSVSSNMLIEERLDDIPVNMIFIPEVTYINSAMKNITKNIIREAKKLKLKVSFVFYDDTPIHRTELSDTKEKHASYMCDIYEADYIFSISDFSKYNLIKLWNKNKITPKTNNVIKTIYLGSSYAENASEKNKKITHKNNISLDSCFILCIGSITEHKNQLSLIKAFIQFKKRNSDNKLKLILAGSISHDVKGILKKITSNRTDIKIIEGLSNEDIITLYQNCLFSVFPSLIEGFGLPILESIYFHKPCITANFGAMKEISDYFGGCLNVDTSSTEILTKAIETLVFDLSLFEKLRHETKVCAVRGWNDYVGDVINIWQRRDEEFAIHKKNKRIFWLGMHKVLVKTELPRLRSLGFEVFNPPYLADVADQSANLIWDRYQETTLPREVFATLSQTNFFYIEQLDEQIVEIINTYFDHVLVTISPTWLAPILHRFQGNIIFRVYGQSYAVIDEFRRLGIEQLAKDHTKFYFLPHATEVVEKEAWLKEKAVAVPYCLSDDVFGYTDSWVLPDAKSGSREVALTCPNITNPYYAEHYKLLKKHFHEPFYKLYGVQLEKSNDPAVVGTIPRHRLIELFQKSSCYVYTYTDPNVCYLPPIEAMVIGLPVLFPKGCLLDKYFNGEPTPARFSDYETCKLLVKDIRTGNTKIINEIITKQRKIIMRYKPSDVWPIFDQFFANLKDNNEL